MYAITWLTGHSGAGKTTLAKEIQKDYPCIILDGDEMRNSISLGAGFSPDDRSEHNYRVARLARELVRQTNIIVSVIAPLIYTRMVIKSRCPLLTFVYIKRVMPPKEDHFYEESSDYPTIDTDKLSVKRSVDRLMEIIDSVSNRTKVSESSYTI